MAKWIAGTIMAILVLVLLLMSFTYPLFSIDKELDDGEWDRIEFGFREYQFRSSNTTFDTNNSGTNDSKSSERYEYNEKPREGGWDGSSEEIVNATKKYLNNSSEQRFRPIGGREQLKVLNTFYMTTMAGMILAALSIVMLALGGLKKLTAALPTLVCSLLVICMMFGPIYLAWYFPKAINSDINGLKAVSGTGETGYDPIENLTGFMGSERLSFGRGKTLTIDYGPDMGWFMTIGAIFLSIGVIACVEGRSKSDIRYEDDRTGEEAEVVWDDDDFSEDFYEYTPPSRGEGGRDRRGRRGREGYGDRGADYWEYDSYDDYEHESGPKYGGSRRRPRYSDEDSDFDW